MLRNSLLWMVALCLLALPASAQRLAPSVYVGAGGYTNLGGEVGAGVELRVGRRASINGAVGYLLQDTELSVQGARRDYDVGVKLYPMANWLYLGINYGLVDYWLDDRENPAAVNRTHALSFTAGARSRAWRRLYASAFVGTTSDSEANRMIGDGFMPRLGIMAGYQLYR
jgi:hypothetical protein